MIYISRRLLLAYLGATACSPACAQPLPGALGRGKPDNDAPVYKSPAPSPRHRHSSSYKGGCALFGANAVGGPRFEKLFASSGNPSVDQSMAFGMNNLAGVFRVRPGFAFFDDGGRPNAWATRDPHLGPDGSIYFGTGLFQAEAIGAVDKTTWGTAALLILAHEWAHILQFHQIGALMHSLPTVAPAELQADMLAGWFLGCWQRRYGNVPGLYINPMNAAKSIFEKGDNEFTSPHHHGTPAQRVDAMRAGLQLSMQVGEAGIQQAFGISQQRYFPLA